MIRSTWAVIFLKHTRNRLPYSDKSWRGENLAQLAKNGKNRQIKSAPNLIIFSLRQIKSMGKKLFSNKKIEICFHTVNLLNRIFSW